MLDEMTQTNAEMQAGVDLPAFPLSDDYCSYFDYEDCWDCYFVKDKEQEEYQHLSVPDAPVPVLSPCLVVTGSEKACCLFFVIEDGETIRFTDSRGELFIDCKRSELKAVHRLVGDFSEFDTDLIRLLQSGLSATPILNPINPNYRPWHTTAN